MIRTHFPSIDYIYIRDNAEQGSGHVIQGAACSPVSQKREKLAVHPKGTFYKVTKR